MTVSKDIIYVGADDHKIDLFEGMYQVPNGMSYNSYVILDEKIAVMDSVEEGFVKEWLKKLETVLGEREPFCLIVQHMEPDHSAGIGAFMKKYPRAMVVASAKAFPMMKKFFGEEYEGRRKIVKEGEVLSLGRHELSFVMAPLVHWPEVMMTYDRTEKVLFSADAFGKFGALDMEEDWACEARRYYFGIVGKFGTAVQNLLKKLQEYEVDMICPLHGPVLKENLSYYMELYHIWSSYEAESAGVLIAYASVYGNTKKAMEYLAECLTEAGCQKVSLMDLCRDDMAEAVEDAFRYSGLVLASVTYNGTVFPPMREFISNLRERNFGNRRIAVIENGAWAPAAGKGMQLMLEESKNIRYVPPIVTLSGTMTEETKQELHVLAKNLMAELS